MVISAEACVSLVAAVAQFAPNRVPTSCYKLMGFPAEPLIRYHGRARCLALMVQVPHRACCARHIPQASQTGARPYVPRAEVRSVRLKLSLFVRSAGARHYFLPQFRRP